MLKKLFFSCLGLFLLALPAAAQQEGEKVLVIVRDFKKPFSAGRALTRAIQFKKAGLEVRVIFEGQGIFNLLEPEGVTATAQWLKKVKDLEKMPAKQAPAPEAVKDPRTPTYKDLADVISGQAYLKNLVNEMKTLKIPYTVCAISANLLGVYDEFKTAGTPLSPDPLKVLDISPYIRENYYIIFSS